MRVPVVHMPHVWIRSILDTIVTVTVAVTVTVTITGHFRHFMHTHNVNSCKIGSDRAKRVYHEDQGSPVTA